MTDHTRPMSHAPTRPGTMGDEKHRPVEDGVVGQCKRREPGIGFLGGSRRCGKPAFHRDFFCPTHGGPPAEEPVEDGARPSRDEMNGGRCICPHRDGYPKLCNNSCASGYNRCPDCGGPPAEGILEIGPEEAGEFRKLEGCGGPLAEEPQGHSTTTTSRGVTTELDEKGHLCGLQVERPPVEEPKASPANTHCVNCIYPTSAPGPIRCNRPVSVPGELYCVKCGGAMAAEPTVPLAKPIPGITPFHTAVLDFIDKQVADAIEAAAEGNARLTRDMAENLVARLQERADEWHVAALEAAREGGMG